MPFISQLKAVPELILFLLKFYYRKSFKILLLFLKQ